VGPRSCWTSRKKTGRLACQDRSNTPRYPCSLAPTIAKIRHTRYSSWRRTLSHNSLTCQIPSVSSEELALPHFIRCELFRLRCHGHSLLLSSYLCRIKRKENRCGAWPDCCVSVDIFAPPRYVFYLRRWLSKTQTELLTKNSLSCCACVLIQTLLRTQINPRTDSGLQNTDNL